MMFGYFAGYLGADPEERMTTKGKRVVSFRLGVKTRVGSKDETVWCRCNLWHDRYDKMLPYLKKGSAVIVGGDIAVESYMSRDNTPQASLVISVDTLKFSPFGRSDSSKSHIDGHGQSSATYDSDVIWEPSSAQDMVMNDEYMNDNVPF